MSVIVLFEPKAAPGQEHAVHSMLAEILPDTRAFDGCESLTAHRDEDDPAQLVLIEYWRSREHYDAYLQWRAERGDIERLGALLAGPPVIRYLADVGI